MDKFNFERINFMYGYIYKTTNLINGKIYIGQKKSTIFLDSDYLGSGVRLKSAIKHYGKENFKVELLEECYSREQLNDREIYYIGKYNSQDLTIGYNLTKGGDGVGGLPAWNKGLTKDKDSRLIQSEDEKLKRANSLHIAHQEGKFDYKNMFTEEVRKKMSDKAKARPHPPTTSNTKCFTNGVDNKMLYPEQFDEYIQKGYWQGKTFRNKKEPWNKGKKCVQISANKNKICINNGLKNKYILPELYEEYHAQGWEKGMRPRNIK